MDAVQSPAPGSAEVETGGALRRNAVGLTGAVIGSRGGGPGVRVVGRRRLGRLVELLGEPPPGAPPECFPSER